LPEGEAVEASGAFDGSRRKSIQLHWRQDPCPRSISWPSVDAPISQHRFVNVLTAGHLVDFLWPAQKVCVETDSWGHHGDRPTFEKDRQTDVDLVAAGYEVHRATYKMLERNPGPFLNNVRRALATRTASNFLSPGPEI
jgi:hypothetical protein